MSGAATGDDPRDRVGWRHSVVTRLLLVMLAVAAAAVGATAWLSVHTTTSAISRQQGRSIAEQERAYTSLVDYAVAHRDWSGVGPEVDRLARDTGGRVTLTTTAGRVLADSADRAAPAGRPAAVIDPLGLDPTDPGGTQPGRSDGSASSAIDARIVGPYQLTSAEQARLRVEAHKQYTCAIKAAGGGQLVTLAGGRPLVRYTADDPEGRASCMRILPIEYPVASERRPLRELTRSLDACLAVDVGAVAIGPGFTLPPANRLAGGVSRARAQACLTGARRSQLAPYVAPAAYLYLDDPVASAASVRLTRGSVLRVVAVTGAVLVLAVLAALVLARRIARPLRRLTTTARRPEARAADFRSNHRDEIGVLGRALAGHVAQRDQDERTRRALVSDVAHELRSPVTTMRGWLEAADAGLAETDHDLVALLLDEVQLLQSVLEDLRDLAAADAGTLRIRPEVVVADQELTRVVEGRRAAAQRAGVRLESKLAAATPTSLDPVRLRQLVGNLVDNALAHTNAGGRITVGGREDDGTLVVEVVDTGEGIAPEHVPHVFERFWRADASRSRRTGGSGLGLAVVRQLAEAHGGSVDLVSEVGHGTTVTVRLPGRSDAPTPTRC